jgi:acetyl-CoA carboxylase biotin carboxyl carrier protein
MALSDEDIREILRIVDESDLDELRLETEGFSLHVRKGTGGVDAGPPRAPGRPQTTEDRVPLGGPESTPSGTVSEEDGLHSIDAPMLGTFYRAEAPGKPPFVEVGQEVEPDTIVCIIEVMKMMNSVPAGVSGKIAEIVAENGELVEYGQPLFRVQPA